LNNILERLQVWNERRNGLPRKGWLILLTLIFTWIFVLIFPLCWPFLLALLFSMLLAPLVRLCESHTKRIKLPRWLITLVGVILLFGILGVGFFFLFQRMFRELVSLSHSIPELVGWISSTAIPYLQGIYQQYSDMLPVTAIEALNKGLISVGDTAMKTAGSLSAALTSGAMNAATSIPGTLLSIVLTIMGTFYFTLDRERISGFVRRTFPDDMQKHGTLVKNNLFRSLFGQIKSQLTVSLIITTFLVLAFVIYGVRYGLLLGFIIGIADALPVIGAGLFLIPWAAVSLLVGNYAMGIFLFAVYIGTMLIRQISEPRIVGANLGLYPLATMMAMFAGFQLIGVLGLIAGPIMLNLLKVVLEADDIARGEKKQLIPPRTDKRGIRLLHTRSKKDTNTP
jgi:sporulation integral membrane protein YtvI